MTTYNDVKTKRRQRRRKTRVDRIEAADRGKQHQQQQQQQRQSREDEKNASAKEWENNDSWKTIPRDEKSWQVYRNAMDIWETTNNESPNERNESSGRYVNGSNTGRSRRGQQESKDPHSSKNYSSSRAINSDCETSSRKQRPKKTDVKNDYDQRERQEAECSSRYTNGDDRYRESDRRKRNDDRRDSSKHSRQTEESEGDETEGQNDDEETYGTNDTFKKDYDAKKFYKDNHRDESTRRYREDDRKYENEKSESEVSTSDSEDTSTITIPETGRKVEHIAQKLEQTAQKYAREHSPPKFVERRRPNDTEYKPQQQPQQQQQINVERDEKPPPSYERAYENSTESRTRSSQRFDRDRGYQNENGNAKQQSRSSTSTLGAGTATYERTFEKNPERKRNVAERASSSRRFEQRPRPPFEDAPERPTERPGGYRERRYSEKEEIYGETGRYSRDPGTLEKDRGYESNFETKLERNKVIEKVQQVAYRSRVNGGAENPRNRDNGIGVNGRGSAEVNDNNNNTLKNERKNVTPRQTTGLGNLVPTGTGFDFDTKSPKLVKRTKSFWRFRRDSDVLEGMALWQHRSLVDIPKMLKRESMEDKSKDEEEPMKVTPEGSPGSGKSIGKESRSSDNTITNEQHRPSSHHHQKYREREQRQDEPKPAERMHVPEKSDYFESDFPTPAERPKLAERSEYRMHREERALFVGNVSRKAIIEKERKRSMEAKRNMVVAELKENNEAKKGDRRNKTYGDDDDGLMQRFSETEASDEESTYSCIVVKDQAVTEKTLLPRTKLRRDSDRERDKNTCGPWYDLWGVDNSVPSKKKSK